MRKHTPYIYIYIYIYIYVYIYIYIYIYMCVCVCIYIYIYIYELVYNSDGVKKTQTVIFTNKNCYTLWIKKKRQKACVLLENNQPIT